MRRGLWHIALIGGCLVASQRFVAAHQSPSTLQHQPCPLSTAGDDKPTDQGITITQVTFSGDIRLPVSEQEAIAESIREATHGNDPEGVVDEALERARRGWQDRGYFKVEVRGDAKILTSNPVSQRIALDVHVDEGSQYTLSRISFKNNKAIKNRERLRQLFPINDGDIFSREKIGTGLENLRKAYDELGYMNFTSVPDTSFDEGNRSISLIIDVDEGQQFRFGAIRVLGLEDAARRQLLMSLPIKSGQIYTSRDWEQTWQIRNSSFPCECPNRESRRSEAKSGILTLTFDFRPCDEN